MKTLFFSALIALTANVARADDAECMAIASETLTKVGLALGMGGGLAHLGGGEILKKARDQYGNTLTTIGGGLLVSKESDDWFISGTAATIETVQTKRGCKVNKIAISTGADVQAAAESTAE